MDIRPSYFDLQKNFIGRGGYKESKSNSSFLYYSKLIANFLWLLNVCQTRVWTFRFIFGTMDTRHIAEKGTRDEWHVSIRTGNYIIYVPAPDSVMYITNPVQCLINLLPVPTVSHH